MHWHLEVPFDFLLVNYLISFNYGITFFMSDGRNLNKYNYQAFISDVLIAISSNTHILHTDI